MALKRRYHPLTTDLYQIEKQRKHTSSQLWSWNPWVIHISVESFVIERDCYTEYGLTINDIEAWLRIYQVNIPKEVEKLKIALLYLLGGVIYKGSRIVTEDEVRTKYADLGYLFKRIHSLRLSLYEDPKLIAAWSYHPEIVHLIDEKKASFISHIRSPLLGSPNCSHIMLTSIPLTDKIEFGWKHIGVSFLVGLLLSRWWFR